MVRGFFSFRDIWSMVVEGFDVKLDSGLSMIL